MQGRCGYHGAFVNALKAGNVQPAGNKFMLCFIEVNISVNKRSSLLYKCCIPSLFLCYADRVADDGCASPAAEPNNLLRHGGPHDLFWHNGELCLLHLFASSLIHGSPGDVAVDAVYPEESAKCMLALITIRVELDNFL